jgi:hypothetical protein
MGQHHLDPLCYAMGKDDEHPVKIIPHSPPAHPEVTGMWGWVRMIYADGVELVIESGEWGEPFDKPRKLIGRGDLSEEERRKLDTLPDEPKLLGFGEAVKSRQQSGGNADVGHHSACLFHLANVAIRTGRTIHFDPKTERAIGDEQANRLISQPLRAPWHL